VKSFVWILKIQKTISDSATMWEIFENPKTLHKTPKRKCTDIAKICNNSPKVSIIYLSLTSTLGPGDVRWTSKRFSSSFQNRRSISIWPPQQALERSSSVLAVIKVFVTITTPPQNEI
jgi:hypothetical protein